MLPNAVKLKVSASVPLECEFWTEDDGWKGACVELSVTVHGIHPLDMFVALFGKWGVRHLQTQIA